MTIHLTDVIREYNVAIRGSPLMPKLYSTAEVAKAANITKMTLHHWVWKGRVPRPKQQMAGNVTVWLWTEKELQNVMDFRANHFKGKGRSKPKHKRTAKA